MTVRHRHVHRDWRDDARAWREQMKEDAQKWQEDTKNWIDNANPFSDGNSNSNKQRADEGNDEQPSQNGDGEEPKIKTIYKTLSATFEGEVGGYKTLDEDTSEPTKAAKDKNEDQSKAPTAKATATADKETATAEKKKALQTDTETDLPTAIAKPTVTSVEDTVLVKATGKPTASAALHTANEADITSAASGAVSATSVSDASASNSNADAGASAGAKAGIAFGVLGGLLVIGLLVFFIFNRRKNQAREKLEDDHEKLHEPAGDAAFAGGVAASSNPRAPRLSLRPVTQFFPGFNAEKRTSKGAAMALAPGAASARGGPWDRPSTSQSTHSANPFGNHAERAHSPVSEEHNMYNKPMPPSPVNDGMSASDPFTANGPPVVAGAAAAGVVTGATALARKTSMRRDGPNKVDLTLPPSLGAVPPSPSGTEFSDTPETPGVGPAPSAGAAAIAAAGGPANTAVHRVQLDFSSTLEDEMDLKAGQLVRLLHEYDDGWALCIRLDRSQQGVVPRTCLSTRPVKPRPPPGAQRSGPPINPQGPPRGPPNGPGYPRGPPPNGMGPQGRPRGASGSGPMSPFGPGPNARSQSPMGRPAGPFNGPGPVPQSPGPRMQGPPSSRSQSPSGMSRRMSPPGPNPMLQHQSTPSSPINRKPVPGQAL
ncbi:hypothetical protein NLU13_0708 [Sarocladium strictum]|uniref:SH3 domain-containing protein n=1 Tax=Sarocladium strictum TaxID=5046 RepID=A0AA39GPJ9_SARSR|nr:hypothetical protein NLU13_0708 [Sarocladium strictum]